MSTTLRRFLLALAFGVLALANLTAQTPAEVIAKARAYLGPEALLNEVQSIRYVGRLTVEREPALPDQPVPGALSVEIIFQKPARQRSVIKAPQRIETTVLDGYDGWQRLQDPADESRWTLSLLRTEQIKNLRANVAENLSFFRGMPDRGMNVEDLGSANVEGVECRKLAFVYSPQIAFIRYFDTQTGRLVLTETRQGESIREQGEIMSGGIRFPGRLVTTIRGTDGSTGRITIDFDAIHVNESFPDSFFSTPSLGRQ